MEFKKFGGASRDSLPPIHPDGKRNQSPVYVQDFDLESNDWPANIKRYFSLQVSLPHDSEGSRTNKLEGLNRPINI